jgi:hypothetical protein
MPRRIQLSRSKGSRLPARTVKVDRSTRWGNPYRVGASEALVLIQRKSAIISTRWFHSVNS